MMNKMIKKLSAVAIAAAMTLSTGVAAQAATLKVYFREWHQGTTSNTYLGTEDLTTFGTEPVLEVSGVESTITYKQALEKAAAQTKYNGKYSFVWDKDHAEYLSAIKIGRTYEDYIDYISNNSETSIVQMDTVIGTKDSSKVLLTLHFVKFHFQLAYLLDKKDSISVTNALNTICNNIGVENFKLLFNVILTDNGTEFSNPSAIEINPENDETRCHVFFCHPYSSFEKGNCEKNHEYIRYVLPKGTNFDTLTQDKVNLMMSHINSTLRPSVKCSPYDYMALTYGKEILDLLKIKKIDSKEVKLKPNLLK